MGCTGSKNQQPTTKPGVKREDPKPVTDDKFWNEPTHSDTRVRLTNGDKEAIGNQGGAIYVAHKNNKDKVTRYYFKVNASKNGLVDVKIGLHHLVTEDLEGGKKEYYVDDSWMVGLKNGVTRKETYVVEKEDNVATDGKVEKVNTKNGDIVMLEVRGDSFSLWIDWQEVSGQVFKDKEIAGEGIYVAIEFDNADGDIVHYFGYDELDASAPKYVAPALPNASPAKGKKPTPAKTETKPAAKPTPAKK